MSVLCTAPYHSPHRKWTYAPYISFIPMSTRKLFDYFGRWFELLFFFPTGCLSLNFLTLPVCLFIQLVGIQYSTHFGCCTCTCVRPPNIKSTPNRIATRETRASWAYSPPAHTFQPIRVVYVMNLHSFGTVVWRVVTGECALCMCVRLIFNIFRSI